MQLHCCIMATAAASSPLVFAEQGTSLTSNLLERIKQVYACQRAKMLLLSQKQQQPAMEKQPIIKEEPIEERAV